MSQKGQTKAKAMFHLERLYVRNCEDIIVVVVVYIFPKYLAVLKESTIIHLFTITYPHIFIFSFLDVSVIIQSIPSERI